MTAPLLHELTDVLSKAAPWLAPVLEAAMHEWLTAKGLAMKDVAQAARVALTGRTASPGLFDVMVALGRDRVVSRLETAADRARATA
jgi:glutamyl-tRNA synthetase